MTKKMLISGLLLAGVVSGVSAQRLSDAQEAIEQEQYDKAKTILEGLIQKKPKDAENYFYLGQIHLVNEKIDSAEYVFRQGAESNSRDKLNTVGLGAVELYKGEEASAESKFTEATSGLGRRDYLPLYYVGRAYIDAPTPNYTKAIEYLTQAGEKNAKDANIPTALGDAYMGLEESNQAYVNYRNALMIDDGLLAPRIGQAVISRWAQAYDVVIEDLNKLIAEHPNYAPLYRELADTYYYSSLKASEDEYRELNQKGLEAYKKYLEVSGDQSIEAKVRYADFLVYTQNYDELKVVSQELTNAPGVDAKVYRYLGYIAFLQDQDYEASRQHLNKLFEEVEEHRLISRDYLMAGLAELAVEGGDVEKGTKLLKEAVAKEDEDEDLYEEIANTAFAKYQDGENAVAKRLFAFSAANPDSDYYFDSNYYLGTLAYQEGSQIYTGGGEGGEGQVPDDLGAARLEAARPDLEAAVEALDIVGKSTKEDVVEKYQVNALYYKGLSLFALDNMQYNMEEAKGIFIPTFEELISVLNAKGELQPHETGYLVDAKFYIAYYSYLQGDHEKAKALSAEILELDPTHENAQFFLENL